MNKKGSVRIQISVSPVVAAKVLALSELTGMTQSALSAMAVQAGLDAIGLALNPEWKDYFEAVSQKYDKEGLADE